MSVNEVLRNFIPYSERILITGCHGLLGQKLFHLLKSGNKILGVDLAPQSHLEDESFQYFSLDISKRNELIGLVDDLKPSFIINTAAITGVDLCESEKELCWRVNVLAVDNLIRAAKKTGAHLIQISSDYVFDGLHPPYSENDPTNPLGFYGKSKLASENALRGTDLPYTIIRTQVLYGVAPEIRANFVSFVRDRLHAEGEISIVDDQRGCPTLADDLADGIARIMLLRKTGIYHISGRDSLSRYEFARRIAMQFSEDPERIKPIKTASLKQKAARPPDSSFVLKKIEKELMFVPRGVAEGLQEYHKQWEQQTRVYQGRGKIR